MVTSFLALLLLTPQLPQGESATFSDGATAELYALARVRHVRQDSLVRDYQAVVHTRMDVTAGKSRFARQTALVAHEACAQVTWRTPNDLRVRVLGARSAAPVLRMMAGVTPELEDDVRGEFRQEVWFDRPWFIPRSLGDSIRLMGVPDRAALHPLAAGATDHYRFAITDSVSLSVPGRDVHAVKMRVEPKELGPSLVAGDMWIDRETGDVVRLMIVFVGTYLWEEPDGTAPEDSAEARKENEWANRVLSVEADIEYALVRRQFWLPHRQLLAITAEIPWFVNATIPARAVSTFGDYRVNTSPDLSFVLALEDESIGRQSRTRIGAKVGNGYTEDESTHEERYRNGYFRAGVWSDGRWEVDVPPADSLASYEWDGGFKVALDSDEQRRIRESVAELARISEGLPPQWIGQQQLQMAWQRFSDIIRFNRVQGLSLGAGLQFRPGLPFTTVLVGGRFAFGDMKPAASVVLRRDGPGGRLDLSAYWDVREVESWTGGLGIGNSINAFFTGHDDAEYYRSLGGGLSYQWNAGLLRDFQVSAFIESHESTPTAVSAPIPNLFGDGAFPENAPVAEDVFLRSTVTRLMRIGFAELHGAVELLGNPDTAVVRFWGSAAIPFKVIQRTGTLTLRAGAMAGDSVAQMGYRLGGPQTVRGYLYGTRAARRFWSAQLDFALRRSAIWAPVIFADIGDTFSSDPLIGGGVGLSLLNGMIRFSLSKGFRPANDVRFDLVFRAPR
ncbi:MAG: hypothetical protein JSW71_20330 [Gemmatimonadota bacterium]|nr:MAG: hypothetical protein JSW71_20330 [Gemmatimonadota bacterium]